MIAIKLHFSIDARLLPKGWHRTSDLNVGKEIATDINQLFSLTKVSHVPFAVNSSRVVPSSSNLP
jgi:hypothetical protein